ncbi:MAG: phosphodiester glycosidase family protein [Nitrospirae bacterium]|nr:phosphodiester glycosidase family protein [Nitrospirota bacterium]
MNRLLLRIVVLVAGLWAGGLAPVSAQDLSWDQIAEGLAVTVWEPGASCRDQVASLYLVKVDPERVRFSTYYFRDEGLPAPLTIQEWQRRTHAVVLFNAGLFREDFAYLGLLYKDGRSLGSKRHPQWQGLFVAEPIDPVMRKARVLDLAVDSFTDSQPSYREAAQSLMLFDQVGRPRVRQTGKQAHQTIVGEDGNGNILLIKTAATTTLRDLAECLRDRFPTLRHAMAMDGGSSSDLLIGGEFVRTLGAGDDRSWQPLVDGSQMVHIPLPSVIGLFHRAVAAPSQGDKAGPGRSGRP